MKGITLLKKDFKLAFFVFLLLLLLSFGFGYFFGRLEQITINKSLLQEIPDVNCGSEIETL